MRTTIAIFALAAFLTAPSLAPAAPGAGFDSCEDARSYGYNTSSFFVAQAFARVKCKGSELGRAEERIASALSRMVFGGNDAAIAVCLYDGIYDGYLDRLGHEYAACGWGAPSPSSRGTAAAAVFVAAYDSLAGALEGADVVDIFTRDEAVSASSACASAVDGHVGAELPWSASLQPLVDLLKQIVCLCLG